MRIQLTEGFKINQELINSALSNPDFTMGFELEFFVVGLTPMLKNMQIQNTSTVNGKTFKKLADATWFDFLSYFNPIGAGSDIDDNEEIIHDRLENLYGQEFPYEPVTKISSMFNKLKEKYGSVSHLMAVLRVYPRNTFPVGDPALDKKLRYQILKNAHPSLFKSLENMEFTIGKKDLHDHGTTREMAYELLAQRIEEYIGETVNVIANEFAYKGRGHDYQTWTMTHDNSLENDEDDNVIGIELVSPVYNGLAAGLQILDKMLELLGDASKLGIDNIQFKTTERAGLHINLGMKKQTLNPLKMLVLLDEPYLLKKFGRLDNNKNVVRALATVKDNLFRNPMEVRNVINMMVKDSGFTKQDQAELAFKLISFIRNTKLLSVNLSKLFTNGYVEFRMIGGDGYHKRWNEIRTAVYKMAVVFQVSTNDNLYKKEYLSSLYKYLTQIVRHYIETMDLEIAA